MVDLISRMEHFIILVVSSFIRKEGWVGSGQVDKMAGQVVWVKMSCLHFFIS